MTMLGYFKVRQVQPHLGIDLAASDPIVILFNVPLEHRQYDVDK